MENRTPEVASNSQKRSVDAWYKSHLFLKPTYKNLALALVALLVALGILLVLPSLVMLSKEARYSDIVEKYYQDVPAEYLVWCDRGGDPRFQDIERTPYHTLYSGKGIVHGEVSIELGRLVFRPEKLEASCAGYGFTIVDSLSSGGTSKVAGEFNLNKLLRKKPNCSDGSEPTARGFYALDVRGYAMSNDYITEFNSSHFLDGITMSRYSFDVHVHSVEKVYVPLYWTCPLTV